MSSASSKDQLSRLLTLAPYLQTRGAVPLKEVADDFGVSTQQMLKDLRVLYLCGLPGFGPGDLIEINVEALLDDPEGLVRISNADFLARPLRLGSSEASALIVGLRALAESSPTSSRALVDRTLAKLEALTEDGTVPLVDIRNPEPRADIEGVRLDLENAIATDRQVELVYVVPSRDQVTERVVDPIAVLKRDGNTYLDAWCHLADARRLFRLDRITQVLVQESARNVPELPARDLSDGLFEAGPDDLIVRIRLSEQMRWFAEHYPVLTAADTEDGGLEVTLAVGDELWLVRLALRFGAGLDVLTPPALRDRIRSVAAVALRLQQSTA